MVRSATKGVVAIVAHRLAQRGRLDVDAPVSSVWPEFATHGKGAMPIRWLFTHQAGLAAMARAPTIEEVTAWDPVVEALAALAPNWEPGTRHGYHALTYGWLAGEVLRRVTGKSPGRLVAEELAGPLGLDFFLGAPDAAITRTVPLLPAPPRPAGAPLDPLLAALADPGSLGARAFMLPLFAQEGTQAYLRAEVPGANGVGDARSLARLYAATVSEVDGIRLLDDATLAQAATVQARGADAVVGYETAYATGFQRPFPLRPMAGLDTACVGHYGMGGPLAFADPQSRLGFGYATRQVQFHDGPDPRSQSLAEAARACALAAM